jgi:predicted amidophosphoribosyltransferase
VPHFADIDLVIPVPLHWTRRRSRGYNQAAILAHALVDAFRSTPRCPVSAGHDARVTVGHDASFDTKHDARAASRYDVSFDVVHDDSLDDGHDISVTAGHDVHTPSFSIETVTPGFVSPLTPCRASSVAPGLTENLPICRTDLLVRARRTRTQTRLSVGEKALNVSSAFRVPERFPLWKRLITRMSRHFFSYLFGLFKRCPIKVGHDEPPFPSSVKWRTVTAPESPATVLASARHILLVDDTYTTGATLYACYAALRPYTSARISIATLAAVEGTPSGGP